MSTKAIRRVIEAHRARGPTTRGTPASEIHAALDELDALRSAAIALRKGMYGRGWNQEGVHEAFALINAIANEGER